MKREKLILIIKIVAEVIQLILKGMDQKQAALNTAVKFNIPFEDVMQLIKKYNSKR
ncbi:hypothetical protein [Lysinibacillus sp. G01H]|uniref:hypothetical protein n=1 Tax=Lysinibacillus sp. G01H TaxID=3026425 RepID=UPI00237DE533|nr:hypothetical protein [Lysinibacillus sp. G01H]WDU78844.1 hypothetical protein PSR12_19700 [Lysinibacillus sp. G01H]